MQLDRGYSASRGRRVGGDNRVLRWKGFKGRCVMSVRVPYALCVCVCMSEKERKAAVLMDREEF